MNKVVVIGVGNAGNQVALISELAGFTSLAINASERDLETLMVDDKNVVATILLGDGLGAGKDRAEAKEFIKAGYKEYVYEPLTTLIEEDTDYVFVVSSTGGGTGSGMSPMLAALITNSFPHVTTIPVGIQPTLGESVAALQNSIEYQKEVAGTSHNYMLYDNASYEELSSNAAMEKVNEDILNAFKVVRGDYQNQTKFKSIDEKDMYRMLTAKGRIIISLIENVTQKSVGDNPARFITDVLNSQSHTELQVDTTITSRGLIYDVNEEIYEQIEKHIDVLDKEYGEPVEGFEHVSVTTGDKGVIGLILSGLSFPDDHVQKVLDAIDRYNSVKKDTGSKLLSDADTDVNSLRSRRNETHKEKSEEDIFGMF